VGRLTVVTLTLNEERNIEACLEGVRWADQIIVVDSGSTDRTVDLARRFTQEVLSVSWKGYGHARNLALQHAAGDWVLWLDADERVPPELSAEIREIIHNREAAYDGYEVARRAYFLGKWIRHAGWYPARVTRLFRLGSAHFSETRVHERLLFTGSVGRLHHDLLHYTDDGLEQYFMKFNRYTTLAAQDMHAAGKRAGLLDLLARPPFMFMKMYVARLGFLDGLHGFLLSCLSSGYVFVKYAKLWELSRPSS
jgi:glycosyltransferase involved in cell wall biosynthesis